MAPPLGARPGWSRRAQYSLFFSFLLAIAGLFIGLFMLALSLVSPDSYRAVRGAALDVTAPITGALGEVATTVQGLGSGAGNYWDAARQNGKLKAERQKMLRRMIEAKAIAQENRQLKAALQLRERSERAVASGRIVDTGTMASRVLLISDRSNIVPARMLRTGMAVISTGRGDGTVDLRPLEVGRNPFRRGDIVVTSGTGGLYPPLVPVARVVRLDDDGAIAVPLADPSDTSFAVVEAPYEQAAIEAAQEPR